MKSFDDIINKAKAQRKKPRVVIAPAHDEQILSMLPEIEQIAHPVLVADAKQIKNSKLKTKNYELINVSGEKQALLAAVEMVRFGEADILMQGPVENTLFRDIVLDRHSGIGTASMSHVFLLEDPSKKKMFMITDAMLHASSSLKQKISILNNALSLARILKIKTPKIAAIAALEYVNPLIASTIDAAVLSKMGERGQFGEATIEGPLDIDCAVSKEAAFRKGVSLAVTGDVDIYLVHDSESGLHFAQFLSLLGNMPMIGIIVGSTVPVVLNMRSMSLKQKLTEIALASLESETV
jgi:phosphotransacetylase